MRLLGTFPKATFALVLIALVGYCASMRQIELLFIAGALAALSWYITEGPRGKILPRWVSNVLVIAVSLSVLVNLILQPGDYLGSLGRFSIWLAIIKLFERRTARDHSHLIGLSVLLMFVGCMQKEGQDLLFGLILLVFGGLALYVLLLYQLFSANETHVALRRASRPEGGVVMSTLRPTLGRGVRLHFRSLYMGIGALGFAFSVVLFVIFPRGMRLGTIPPQYQPPTLTALTGYTDQINLTSGARINESDEIVMEMELRDESGEEVRLEGPLYLRGAVLERYDRGVWSERDGEEMEVAVEAREGASLPNTTGAAEGGVRQRIRFRMRSARLFSLSVPVRVSSVLGTVVRWDARTQTLRNETPMRQYVVLSDVRIGYGSDRFDVEEGETVDEGMSWQRDDAERRIGALSERLLRNGGVGRRPVYGGRAWWAWCAGGAEVLQTYLLSEEFQYTLDRQDVVARGMDPLEEFLLESRRGHCEFFASALALMCRTVGIEARVVSGYAAHEYEPTMGVHVVRARDAHAWVEVRVGERTYQRMDPTPTSIVAMRDTEEGGLTSQLGWLYERLEGTWSSAVIGFDDRNQTRLLTTVEERWLRRGREALDSVGAWMMRVNQAFRLGPAGYIWLGIVGIAVVLAMGAAVRVARRVGEMHRTFRLRGTNVVEAGRYVRQLGFYVDMLRVLQRAGAGKPNWMPPQQYARELGEGNGRASAIVEELTAMYYDARFGGRALSAAERRQARERVNALPGALRGM